MTTIAKYSIMNHHQNPSSLLWEYYLSQDTIKPFQYHSSIILILKYSGWSVNEQFGLRPNRTTNTFTKDFCVQAVNPYSENELKQILTNTFGLLTGTISHNSEARLVSQGCHILHRSQCALKLCQLSMLVGFCSSKFSYILFWTLN